MDKRVTKSDGGSTKISGNFDEKLNDYPQAVVEYQRLLEANPTLEEQAEYKLRLGRAYFYMANFDQAISETQEYISEDMPQTKRFEFLMLQGLIASLPRKNRRGHRAIQ